MAYKQTKVSIQFIERDIVSKLSESIGMPKSRHLHESIQNFPHQSNVLSKERSNIPPTLNYNCFIILFIFNLKLFLVMKNIYIQGTYILSYNYAYVSKIMIKIEVNNKSLKSYSAFNSIHVQL